MSHYIYSLDVTDFRAFLYGCTNDYWSTCISTLLVYVKTLWAKDYSLKNGKLVVTVGFFTQL